MREQRELIACPIQAAGLISRAKETFGIRSLFFREGSSDSGFVCIKTARPFVLVAYLVDCADGINGAAPKFLLNRLHHTDTVRYFAKSKSEPRV